MLTFGRTLPLETSKLVLVNDRFPVESCRYEYGGFYLSHRVRVVYCYLSSTGNGIHGAYPPQGA